MYPLLADDCRHHEERSLWVREAPRSLDSQAWSRSPRPREEEREEPASFSEGPREPDALRQLKTAIERSRVILTLGDDWDDEGSPGYKEATWKRATDYLKRQALVCWRMHDIAIPAPRISPGPNGSIDMHWETASYELLANVPEDPSTPASFYGDDFGALRISGTFDPDANPAGHLALVSWLIKD